MTTEIYIKNTQVPQPLLTLLKQASGDRAFFNRSETGLEAFIVLNGITKKELEEFNGSLSVIYQDYGIPFIILKYECMSFDMPLLPNLAVDNFASSLTVYVIDSKDYILKQIRYLGLEERLATEIHSGLDTVSMLRKEAIPEFVMRKIYPVVSRKDMLKGGIRQRFERS
jgi:hypothetical protein